MCVLGTAWREVLKAPPLPAHPSSSPLHDSTVHVRCEARRWLMDETAGPQPQFAVGCGCFKRSRTFLGGCSQARAWPVHAQCMEGKTSQLAQKLSEAYPMHVKLLPPSRLMKAVTATSPSALPQVLATSVPGTCLSTNHLQSITHSAYSTPYCGCLTSSGRGLMPNKQIFVLPAAQQHARLTAVCSAPEHHRCVADGGTWRGEVALCVCLHSGLGMHLGWGYVMG